MEKHLWFTASPFLNSLGNGCEYILLFSNMEILLSFVIWPPCWEWGDGMIWESRSSEKERTWESRICIWNVRRQSVTTAVICFELYVSRHLYSWSNKAKMGNYHTLHQHLPACQTVLDDKLYLELLMPCFSKPVTSKAFFLPLSLNTAISGSEAPCFPVHLLEPKLLLQGPHFWCI